MKKIFSLLLVVSMLCAMMISVSAHDVVDGKLVASATEVTVGEEFTVDIMSQINNTAYGIAVFKVTMKWDKTAAELVGMEKADLANAVSGSATVNKTSGLGNATMTGDVMTTNGVWFKATFRALKAGEFTVAADTSTASKSFISYKNADATGAAVKAQDFAPATITIKDAAAADPYTYTAAAETADELVLVDGPYTKKYTNVLVAKDSVAADTTAVDYGFVLVKGETKGSEISCKAAAVAGEGVLEFGIVMYNVTEDGVTAQKYVKAAQ